MPEYFTVNTIGANTVHGDNQIQLWPLCWFAMIMCFKASKPMCARLPEIKLSATNAIYIV